ncbi:peptidase S8/S53 domain-containing protein [Lactarius vividus]|nr:peptidase S8/S53 domain-containing protein [Lactarius vividus]
MYHLIPVLSVLATILLGSLAKPFPPRWDDTRIKHSWNAVPDNWENLGNPLSGTTIDLYVALKAHRENALIDTLSQVSNPNHPRHVFFATPSLMPEQVAELVSPPPGTLKLVNSWLEYHGVPSSPNALLGASYQLYRHVETNETVVRTIGYALPAALHGSSADYSADDVLFHPSHAVAVTAQALGRGDSWVEEAVIRRDLSTVVDTTRPTPAVESNLDTQYAVAMTYPTPVIFYSTGRGPAGTTDWFTSWFGYILKESNIPRTISISYVVDERNIPEGYATYMCSRFAMLGVLGVSVLISSGDDGCSAKGTALADDGSVRFVTNFPATCPHVTAVGGTTSLEPEHIGNQYEGKYNATSRGIPDISVQALNFPIFLKGKDYLVDGTSGSTPIAASIISLLNDHLVSQGKVTLGFLNPWLYGPGKSGLTDITSGSNPGCNTDGFSAVNGWDPVTGVGTPDFQRLLSVLPDYAEPSGAG